ncbi:MAG: tRNA (guanosine(46)-N7)-methyltransferase TrmB [Ruminococcaceae bacterium]|nr:tRNA (guanosine(46)-N7)-methyltransferase TrmB [Oscillospiraceae bacterium]
MRIRKKKWAQPELDLCPYFVKEPQSFFGRWKEFFKNDNEIQLEVGCGKCSFVAQKALNNPDTNFIAVDIKSDMLGVGRRNIEKLFCDNGKTVHNIALVAFNVENIEKLISKEDNIKQMYINFCNPWPREKHKKRRLTHVTKLNKYRTFLSDDAIINFKTDNDELFEESLDYFKDSNFEITYLTRDLHNSDVSDNILTEHETMFSQQGIKIKHLKAKML